MYIVTLSTSRYCRSLPGAVLSVSAQKVPKEAARGGVELIAPAREMSRLLLRCPVLSLPTARLRRSPTAATAPHQEPTSSVALCTPAAAGVALVASSATGGAPLAPPSICKWGRPHGQRVTTPGSPVRPLGSLGNETYPVIKRTLFGGSFFYAKCYRNFLFSLVL